MCELRAPARRSLAAMFMLLALPIYASERGFCPPWCEQGDSLCANEACEACPHCIDPFVCAAWCNAEICFKDECRECGETICPPVTESEPDVQCQDWCHQHESLCENEACSECEQCLTPPHDVNCANWCTPALCWKPECDECGTELCPPDAQSDPASPEIQCEPWCSQHQSLCANELCTDCEQCLNPPVDEQPADATDESTEPGLQCEPWCAQHESLCTNEFCSECEQCISQVSAIVCADWCQQAQNLCDKDACADCMSTLPLPDHEFLPASLFLTLAPACAPCLPSSVQVTTA